MNIPKSWMAGKSLIKKNGETEFFGLYCSVSDT